LSTLAIEGSSSAGAHRGSLVSALRYGDLALLAVALPVFVIAGWPLPGYAVAAAAWLAQWGIELAANRRVARALRERERRTALGVLGAATLGRVWLVALAVLLVGLLGERQDGLAAAVLSAALITAHLAGRGVERVIAQERSGR
jgi:L-asparagine transporter-like permease